MRTALFIGGRSDYTGPAVRILPRTGARVYLSERWRVEQESVSVRHEKRAGGHHPAEGQANKILHVLVLVRAKCSV